MLRFMDWSVVATGCLLVLGGLGGRWWERNRVREGEGPDGSVRFPWAWLIPLLMGLGMIGAKVPGLLRAPHPVVEAADALNFALSLTSLVVVFRWGRFVRARGSV
jgi:hypothetical protein